MAYKGLGYIEAGRVPHVDYVYYEAICNVITMIRFDRTLKRLRGSYKKLYDIKRILLALKMYSGGI